MAPEVLLLGFDKASVPFDNSVMNDDDQAAGLTLFSSKPKSDIWSVGMILLEMVTGVEFLSESRTKVCNTLRKVMSWIHAKGSAVERILQEGDNAIEQWKV